MDISSDVAAQDAPGILMLTLRYEFADPPDELPPAPFLEIERLAPGAPSAIVLETALRQWRRAGDSAVAPREGEKRPSSARAGDEPPRRTAADHALRRSHLRRIDPPRYRGLRVVRMHLDSALEL